MKVSSHNKNESEQLKVYTTTEIVGVVSKIRENGKHGMLLHRIYENCVGSR